MARWLAVEFDDGQVDLTVPLSSQDELKQFNYLFVNKAKRDLSDAHLWFSIYARPPRSTFSRCQRLSVAMSLLFTHMLANLMFYGRQPAGNPETENKVGSFTVNFQQVKFYLIIKIINKYIKDWGLRDLKLSVVAFMKQNLLLVQSK